MNLSLGLIAGKLSIVAENPWRENKAPRPPGVTGLAISRMLGLTLIPEDPHGTDRRVAGSRAGPKRTRFARPCDKRRARLNALSHILSKIPYEDLPHPKVKLPTRQKSGDYKTPDYPFRVVPEIF